MVMVFSVIDALSSISIMNVMNDMCMHGKNVEFGNLIPGKSSLLEGNICNFEGKCTI